FLNWPRPEVSKGEIMKSRNNLIFRPALFVVVLIGALLTFAVSRPAYAQAQRITIDGVGANGSACGTNGLCSSITVGRNGSSKQTETFLSFFSSRLDPVTGIFTFDQGVGPIPNVEAQPCLLWRRAGPSIRQLPSRPAPIAPALRHSGYDIRSVGGARRIAGFGFIHDDHAAFHHPARLVNHNIHVGEWIAFDGYDVGVIARRDRAQTLLHPEQRRAVRSRSGERLGGRHSRFDEPFKLARILAEHREDGV